MQRRDALKRITWMSGGVLSAPIVSGILQGCQADTDPDWIPQALTEDQATLVAEICETIIPKTDTPGAKDAFVHRYIDIMLQDLFEEEDKNRFMAELDEFAQAAKEKYGKAFEKLEEAQKIEMLQTYESAAQTETVAQRGSEPETPFFTAIKQLTLAGYFTSEVGCKENLVYVKIPGKFEACQPLEPGQKAYAI